MKDELVEILNKLKDEYDCELIKVYFADKNRYTIKFIKNEKIIGRITKGKKVYYDTPKREKA